MMFPSSQKIEIIRAHAETVKNLRKMLPKGKLFSN